MSAPFEVVARRPGQCANCGRLGLRPEQLVCESCADASRSTAHARNSVKPRRFLAPAILLAVGVAGLAVAILAIVLRSHGAVFMGAATLGALSLIVGFALLRVALARAARAVVQDALKR